MKKPFVKQTEEFSDKGARSAPWYDMETYLGELGQRQALNALCPHCGAGRTANCCRRGGFHIMSSSRPGTNQVIVPYVAQRALPTTTLD